MSLLLSCILVWAGADASAPVLEVPRPNPADPVDYVAWINESLRLDPELAADLTDASDELKSINFYARPFRGNMSNYKRALIAPWSAETGPGLVNWVISQRSARALLTKVAARDYCYLPLTPHTDWACKAECVQLDRLDNAVEAWLIDAWMIADTGDFDSLGRRLVGLCRVSRQLRRQGAPKIHLTGMSMSELAYDTLVRALHRVPDPYEFADQYESRLHRNDPPIWPASVFTHARFAISFDNVQRLFTFVNDQGKRRISAAAAAKFRSGAKAAAAQADLPTDADYEETVAAMMDYYHKMVAWMDLPNPEAVAQLPQIKDMVEKSPNAAFRTLVPKVWGKHLNYVRLRTKQNGAHTLYAILAYRARHDKLPERLEDLTGEDVVTFRIDPFTGKNLIYRVTGETFTLYSTGVDRDDDGGKRTSAFGRMGGDGDYVFWPPEELPERPPTPERPDKKPSRPKQ